jgi:hypothetical protein
MYPFWILGILVMWAVIAAGKKQLLKVEFKPVVKWCTFLALLTVWRIMMAKLASYNGIHDAEPFIIPWMASFTVFWEDACHGLPVLLLRQLIGVHKWWAKILNFIMLAVTMFSFGLGHLYQGLVPAMILCMYIPYSIRCGKKYGFGTVMICHMLYDLVTLLFVQYLAGIF